MLVEKITPKDLIDSLTPRGKYLEMWRARRSLYLLDLLTDSQNHSILNKMAKFQKEHGPFNFSPDELHS